MQCNAVLWCGVLYCTVMCCGLTNCTALYYTGVCCAVHCCDMLWCTALCCPYTSVATLRLVVRPNTPSSLRHRCTLMQSLLVLISAFVALILLAFPFLTQSYSKLLSLISLHTYSPYFPSIPLSPLHISSPHISSTSSIFVSPST